MTVLILAACFLVPFAVIAGPSILRNRRHRRACVARMDALVERFDREFVPFCDTEGS